MIEETHLESEKHHGEKPFVLSRRAFVHSGILALSGVAISGCVGGIASRGDIEITHRIIAVPNLPQSFHGFRMTLASDIHSSPFMSLEDMKKIVKIINDLQSEVILLPGDFVTSHHNEIPPFVEAMSELSAPLGIYSCTGNHDYYCGVDLVCKSTEDIGFRMLRNENTKITKNGEHLHLIGIDDDDSASVREYVDGKPAAHIEAALKGVPDDAASILLCHRPYEFESYAKTGVGLMLSGHTHGGQIVFGRIGGTVLAMSSIASKFVEGLYNAPDANNHSKLYVSRGLGVVGLPLRINCPPEITQITLVPAIV